jgi:hypothetical protein
MSKHIASLRVGDSLELKGPIKKLAIKPNQARMGLRNRLSHQLHLTSPNRLRTSDS